MDCPDLYVKNVPKYTTRKPAVVRTTTVVKPKLIDLLYDHNKDGISEKLKIEGNNAWILDGKTDEPVVIIDRQPEDLIIDALTYNMKSKNYSKAAEISKYGSSGLVEWLRIKLKKKGYSRIPVDVKYNNKIIKTKNKGNPFGLPKGIFQ